MSSWPPFRIGAPTLLGETADGTLVHIELQSTNQAGMTLRMLEYAVAIHRQFGRFPAQMVLYVGKAPLRMKARIAGPQVEYSCRMVDIRSLDGEALLASSCLEDNVIAVLARLANERKAVAQILRSIALTQPQERAVAFQELTLLAGLRNLAPVIDQEARQMPILNDIMDHAIIGPAQRRGIEIGLEQGREMELARQRQTFLRLLGKRFGTVPLNVRKQIVGLTAAKLDRLTLRLLDATSLNELLK